MTISSENKPFFIVGSHRSGTTLLRLILNSHSQLAIPFESNFIPRVNQRLEEFGDLQVSANMARLLDEISKDSFVREGQLIRDKAAVLSRAGPTYASLIDAIFSEYALAEGKTRWGDKDPDNLEAMDLLWDLFPGCKFVHLVRDGRDVAVALRKLQWGSRSIPRLAEKWSVSTVTARKIGNVLGKEHYLEVRFEDLLTDPNNVIKRICAFLSVDFEATLLEYHKDANKHIPQSHIEQHQASVSPINPAKLQIWRKEMSRADQVVYEQVAGAALKMFGYECGEGRSTLGSKLNNLKYALLYRW